MNDLHSAHKTLNSASQGYATCENAIGFLRGCQFKKSKKHWSWQPPKAQQKKIVCRDNTGKFIPFFK